MPRSSGVRRLFAGSTFAIAISFPADARQDVSFPISCAAADSALGVATRAQSRADLMQWRSPGGEHTARTGTRQANRSGVAIAARWSPADPAGTLALQLGLTLSRQDFETRWAAGDSVFLRFEDGPELALGVPTPPTVAGPRPPPLLPVTVRLAAEDVAAIAAARSVRARYGTYEWVFSERDLGSTTRLYRVLLCASAAP